METIIISAVVTAMFYMSGFFVHDKLVEPHCEKKDHVNLVCHAKDNKQPRIFLHKHGYYIGVEKKDYVHGKVDIVAPAHKLNKAGE